MNCSLPRFLPLLPTLMLLTACSEAKKANETEPARTVEEKPAAEGGTLRSVIDYGTGATHIKAGEDAKKKLEAIGSERDAQMQEAFE